MGSKIPGLLVQAKDRLKIYWNTFPVRVRRLSLFALTALAVCIINTFIFWNADGLAVFREGEVAERTVRSPGDFTIEDIRIKRGQVLVRAGDVVSRSQESVLKNLEETLGTNKTFLSVALGNFFLAFTGFWIVFAFSTSFWPDFRPRDKDLLVVGLTVVGSLVLEKLFTLISQTLSYSFNSIGPETIALSTPLAAGGIMLQVTLGAPAVFLFLAVFSVVTLTAFNDASALILLTIAGNMVGAMGVKRCSHRSAFITAGLKVAAINIAIAGGLLLLSPQTLSLSWSHHLIWAAVGGVLSGMLGGALAPVAEYLGGYTTDIKLLELSSLERPLLRELSLQAPGTWNHSMVVGQMCEMAAEAIRANPYLARVGAYYHDIGKMKKPAYFVENQASRENRHDKLTPSMSALIIKAHVKDGFDMAEQARLPRAISDCIAQHHGTSLIEYFYEKALKEAEAGEIVDETHYRYPGPRPQTKEAGLLMLADAVEAASRTLSDPTPAKIQGLVQKIINKIFASGELGESNLTLKDLHKIAKSFTRVLSAIYHRRIEYSEPAEKVREPSAPRESKEKDTQKDLNRETPTLVQQIVKINPQVQDSNTLAAEPLDRNPGEEDGGKKAPENSRKKGTNGDTGEALRRLGM